MSESDSDADFEEILTKAKSQKHIQRISQAQLIALSNLSLPSADLTFSESSPKGPNRKKTKRKRVPVHGIIEENKVIINVQISQYEFLKVIK